MRGRGLFRRQALAAGMMAGQVAPTVLSSTVQANGITLIVAVSLPTPITNATGWTFKDGSSTYSLTYVSGSGTTSFTFTIGTAVLSGDTCTISYNASTGNAGTLASFTNASVTKLA